MIQWLPDTPERRKMRSPFGDVTGELLGGEPDALGNVRMRVVASDGDQVPKVGAEVWVSPSYWELGEVLDLLRVDVLSQSDVAWLVDYAHRGAQAAGDTQALVRWHGIRTALGVPTVMPTSEAPGA